MGLPLTIIAPSLNLGLTVVLSLILDALAWGPHLGTSHHPAAIWRLAGHGDES